MHFFSGETGKITLEHGFFYLQLRDFSRELRMAGSLAPAKALRR